MKTLTRAIVIITCTIATFAIASSAQAGGLEDENKQLTDQIIKLKRIIDEMNAEICSLKDELTTCKDENQLMIEEREKLLKENARLAKALKDVVKNANKPSSNGEKNSMNNAKATPRQKTGKMEDHMKYMMIPRFAFKPPATLVDALSFFRTASIDLGDHSLPIERRGFNIVLQADAGDGSIPTLPTIRSDEEISFRDALERVLSSVGYKFSVVDSLIVVAPQDAKIAPPLPRSYAKGTPNESKSDRQLRLEAYEIELRMKKMILPALSFRSPATLVDGVDFFRFSSVEIDDPQLPKEQRGLNFALRLDGNAEVPSIPFIATGTISLWDALNLVCLSTGYKFEISGSVINVIPSDMTLQQLTTRSYAVSESVLDKAFGTGKIKSLEDKTEKWRVLLKNKGVDWPIDASSRKAEIFYVRAVNRLRITNTTENLAKIEKLLKIKPSK